MRFVTIVLFLSTTQAYAQSVYFKYSDWEQMPTSLREIYVAGAFDAVSTVTVAEGVVAAWHYNECVARIGMSASQLSENLKAYAESRPDLQYKSTPGVLMRYLVSVCGTPAPQ
jgi:hypothetical protein